MVENIYRQLARRDAERRTASCDVIIAAAARRWIGRSSTRSRSSSRASCRSMCSPGRRDRLFEPMADTTIFALIGALIVTLTRDSRCSAPWFLRAWRARAAEPRLRVDPRRVRAWPGLVPGASAARRSARRSALFVLVDCCSSRGIGAEFMPKLDEGALWVRATMPVHDLVRGVVEDRAADPRASSDRFPR